ncbi:MAG: class I SAM-dependent methyltransferase [Betaproteobacteria bacterium]|jgi:malonyl-CoA O-methyltransferase
MPVPDATVGAPRPVDAVALARWRRRLRDATGPPWLHAEAARRMAGRLAVVKLQPRAVLDWGLQAGHDRGLLAAAYPQARITAVDPDGTPAPAGATPWWRGLLARPAAPVIIAPAAVADGQAQLLWSSMLLHTLPDPQALFAAWQRALAVDGFLMFCTLGPGTLQTLAAVYAESRWPAPLAPLVDMHDLGDMLVQAGFADPVMDQETLHLTWRDAEAALAELRTLGQNAAPGRAPGLRTPGWRRQLLHRLESRRGADGRVGLEFEIVYGHAFKPPPRPRLAAETTLPLDDLRAMVRRRPSATGR